MTQTMELLTATELAERLRVRPETIRIWSRQRLIPRVQISPKVIRYDLRAVMAALTHDCKEDCVNA